jgi:hypothetical protein
MIQKILHLALFLLLSLSVRSDSSSDSSKPKPKPKPKPSNPEQGDGDGGYYETTAAPSMSNIGTISPTIGATKPFISFCHSSALGTQCGTQGYHDFSYCGVDADDAPVCIAEMSCNTTSPTCTSNVDCSTGQVCALLASPCEPAMLCHNLCGTLQDSPFTPEASEYYAYADTANNRCYDETDLSMKLELSFDASSSLSPLLTPLNLVLASFAAVLLAILAVQRTYLSYSSAEPKFNELPTSSQHLSA